MEEIKYIKDKSKFKCNIDDVTYDCKIKYVGYGGYAHNNIIQPYIVLKIKKETVKDYFLFEFINVEFKFKKTIKISEDDFVLILNEVYFDSNIVRKWVKEALETRDVVKGFKLTDNI